MGAPLLFVLELTVLYAAGSYAMNHLMGISGFRSGSSVLDRVAFYLLVFPGVVLHEGAHYLACLLTGTKVLRFAPFSPYMSHDGRLVLGYVRHERRAFPISTIIGLAPILVNPLGLLLVTALLTPLTFQEVANPSFGLVKGGILTSGFLAESPLAATIWAYLSLSLAVGSVPGREDLKSVPALLVLFCGVILLVGLLEGGQGDGLRTALYELSALAAGLYTLPVMVAAVSASVILVWRGILRH